jgi:hypothetical protein
MFLIATTSRHSHRHVDELRAPATVRRIAAIGFKKCLKKVDG